MEQPNDSDPAQAHPYAKIVVQPYGVSRFRGRGGQRNNGVILGASSTRENRTYPKIKLFNYVGQVDIRVSCVDKDVPYRPHPHKIVGPEENCQDGVYTIRCDITEAQPEVEFRDIGIQYVRKDHVSESLLLRRWRNVNPFNTDYSTDATSHHSVRLAIEVFLPDDGGRFRVPMLPIPLKTDVITDRQSRLMISYASHAAGSAHGGTALALFTENLPDVALKVRFFEESTGWEKEVYPRLIHKMYGMVVDVPPYRDRDTRVPAGVKLELCREPVGDDDIDEPSRSNQIHFEYEPQWVPRRRRLDTSISDESQSDEKKRRVDEKSLNSSLFSEFDGNSPTISVEPIFRENVAQQQPWDFGPSKSDFNVASPSQYYPYTKEQHKESLGRYTPVPDYTNTSNKTRQTGVHTLIQQSNHIESSYQMGQSPHTPSPQMQKPPQSRQSHQMAQSCHAISYNNIVQCPIMEQLYQGGQLSSQSGLSPGPPHHIMVQSPTVEQSPQMGQPYHNTAQSLSVGQSPEARQSHTMGQSQFVHYPPMGQSPHMGQALQAEKSYQIGSMYQIEQAAQIGPLPQARQSPQTGQSPRMKHSPQVGQSSQMRQIGEACQIAQLPQRLQSLQIGQSRPSVDELIDNKS